MNYCVDCGGKVEKGDTEYDKYNVNHKTLFYCDTCKQVWFVFWDGYEQTTTIERGEYNE